MKKGAIILCGGKSRRMGRDKATLPFGPELMLQRVVRLLSQVVAPEAIVIVAGPDQILPKLPEIILRTYDKNPDRGPMEGLAAGFRALPTGTEAVYATSCDVPLMVPEFVSMLFERLEMAEIAVPWDGQFHHPLSAVYRPGVLSMIEVLLASNELRPRFLFNRLPTTEVPVDQLRSVDPQLQTLMNLNHPEDYAAALIQAGFQP